MGTDTMLEADIIIAGGGTSACVLAGRLAAAAPALQILLLEAGAHTRDVLAHVQPGRFATHLLPGSTTIKYYVGTASAHLAGCAPVVPCGQCVGGGSSVNFTMYARPAVSDYDDWEKVYNNPGWGSQDLIPLLCKAETYQIQEGLETHGYGGPLKISHGGLFTSVGREFLDVAARYDMRRERTDDPNDMHECNTYGRWPMFIDAHTGRRSDVAHEYIYKHDYPNLNILPGHAVKRVLFSGTQAVGVEYLPSPRTQEEEVITARARKLVVVAAGALGSPCILERSGIGGSALLGRMSVDVEVDLPGVGENHQAHNVMYNPYFVDDGADTLDGLVRGEPEEVKRWSAQWAKDGSGLLAHSSIDAGIRMRPFADEQDELGPEFRDVWAKVYERAPDKPVVWLGPSAMFLGDASAAEKRKYASMCYWSLYPTSVGRIHIASGDDVWAAPAFDPGYLSRPEDVAVLRWAYKRSRELARRMPCYRGEHAPSHPAFPAGSAAACGARAGPVGLEDPGIVYSEADDEVIDEYLRRGVASATAAHNLGTCAMKPRERGGVVDARLNVYGVRGLKVADMSIAPANVSANTCSTAIVIGEKAAVLILEELGLA